MKKMRYGAMAAAIALVVGGFLGAQRLDLIPGPWSKEQLATKYLNKSVTAIAEAVNDPESFLDYYRRGLHYQKQQQLEQALADLDQAVKLSPVALSVASLGERAANSRLRETHTLNMVFLVRTARADILQQMNRPADALVDLDHALALDPRKADIFFTRGMLKTSMGHYEEALADFNVILDRRTDPQWVFGRGWTHYLKGDWVRAANDFQRAVKMAPQEGAYLVWLTKTYLRAGQPLPPQPFAQIDKAGTTGTTIAAFMSDYDSAQFISGVRAGASSGGGGWDSRCKAALFLGEWLTIRKGGAGARDMFAEAVSVCSPQTIESTTARAELARLPQ